MTRAFARSMWYLSSNTTNGSGPGIHFCHSVDNLGSSNITGLNWQNVSQTCSCGHRARLHTEGKIMDFPVFDLYFYLHEKSVL